MKYDSKEAKPMPSISYLQSLMKTLRTINSGRSIHDRDNCIQSLSMCIEMMSRYKTVDPRLNDIAKVCIDSAKVIIYDHYSNVWKKPKDEKDFDSRRR